MLPELGPTDHDHSEESPASLTVGSTSQARLFEAFLVLLERLAERGSTALVIEDLHWADRSTLDLLTFLVRNLGSAPLLVMTYRTDDVHHRHPLRPSSPNSTAAAEWNDWTSIASTEPKSQTCFKAAWEAVPPTTSSSGSTADPGAMHSLPRSCWLQLGKRTAIHSCRPSLENVLLSRVQILSENAQATLRIAAAASGPVPHQLLAAVSDLPEPNLLAALREAVAHQVLVPDPATETYSFRHALSQEHQINYEATASVSGAPMIMRILIMSRDSNRDTCIWLVPISSAISAWERCS
jgi:hypothetical protein